MRNIVFVILALGGYVLLLALGGGYVLLLGQFEILGYPVNYTGYLAWLPFAAFIWWRLSRLTRRRSPRSLLFAAIFSPALGAYGYIALISPAALWLLFIIPQLIANTIDDPGLIALSLEYLAATLVYMLPPFLLIWIVAYTGMSERSSKRFAGWRDILYETVRSAIPSEINRQRVSMSGLMVLLVIAGAIAFGARDQRNQAIAGLEAIAIQALTDERRMSESCLAQRGAISVSGTPVAEPQTQPTLLPCYPPSAHRYTQFFTSTGMGPTTIAGGDTRLFLYRPSELDSEIEFVKSLTLHIATTDSSRTGTTTVEFTLWNYQGYWGINQMDNQVAWGQNSIDIRFPDNYVDKFGEIFIELRNLGGKDSVDLADINFTLVVQNLDGTESVYAPTQ